MTSRVQMDWLLFWTILILVSLGLVMVYSTTALIDELRVKDDSSLLTPYVPEKAPPKDPAAAGRRVLVNRIVAVAAVTVVLFLLLRRFRQRLINRRWLLTAVAASALLLALVFLQDPYKPAHYDSLLRQATAALGGFLLLMILSQRDYRRLATPQAAFLSLGVVISLLILVMFTDKDAHRWLRFGISLQPSEFAKPALIVFLAWFVSARGDVNNRYTMWPASLVMLFLGGLIVYPDFGTAIVLVVTAATVFYLAGLQWRYTLTAAALAFLLITVAILARPHRLKRVIDFVDPQYRYLVYLDPSKRLLTRAAQAKVSDTRYQPEQSILAVAPGGIFGRGLMQGRQKHLFLPQPQSDYIFATLAEELGLMGSTFVLLLFAILGWRGFRLYLTATDPFGRYLALGVTTCILFQAFLNLSVVLDLGPTKGIPLPLISFGGSSMVASLIMLGLLLSVSQRAQRAPWGSE